MTLNSASVDSALNIGRSPRRSLGLLFSLLVVAGVPSLFTRCCPEAPRTSASSSRLPDTLIICDHFLFIVVGSPFAPLRKFSLGCTRPWAINFPPSNRTTGERPTKWGPSRERLDVFVPVC